VKLETFRRAIGAHCLSSWTTAMDTAAAPSAAFVRLNLLLGETWSVAAWCELRQDFAISP